MRSFSVLKTDLLNVNINYHSHKIPPHASSFCLGSALKWHPAVPEKEGPWELVDIDSELDLSLN